jgi:hypothetical protein
VSISSGSGTLNQVQSCTATCVTTSNAVFTLNYLWSAIPVTPNSWTRLN